ncbi:MAG: hypothetical protein DI586_10485 [Micavibrio aeruginosavorus]|uniref:Uncharacterized protein n=1 Tax=Micavibrio aeruginosavorus TaxID=349221 RepID=A0A2W5FG28_9BACT|nr:MAG: hypothetical protein DI586_10485 [Micavibrio aeruginosavorus]
MGLKYFALMAFGLSFAAFPVQASNLLNTSGITASLASSLSSAATGSSSSKSSGSSNIPGLEEYKEYVKGTSPNFDGKSSSSGSGSLFNIKVGGVTLGVGQNGITANGLGQTANLGTNGNLSTSLGNSLGTTNTVSGLLNNNPLTSKISGTSSAVQNAINQQKRLAAAGQLQ